MNKAQQFVFWLDKHTKIFERIEIGRADWFAREFPIRVWLAGKRKVLDVGSGVGDITNRLQQAADGKVIGIDNTDYRRKGNKDDTSPQFLLCDARSLPFESQTFDCVTIFWVLHHSADPLAIISEAYRVLAVNGTLIIIEDVIDSPNSMRAGLTRFYDNIVNLEWKGHPHSNKSLSDWDSLVRRNFPLTLEEKISKPWFTPWNLLCFGILRYVKR